MGYFPNGGHGWNVPKHYKTGGAQPTGSNNEWTAGQIFGALVLGVVVLFLLVLVL